jgi:hypothetical protein
MASILARGVEQRIGTDKVPRKRTHGPLPLNAVFYGLFAAGRIGGMTANPKGFDDRKRRAFQFWLASLAFVGGVALLGVLTGRVSELAVQLLAFLVLFPIGIYALITHFRFHAQSCPRCGKSPRNTGLLRNDFALACMHCGASLYGSHQ